MKHLTQVAAMLIVITSVFAGCKKKDEVREQYYGSYKVESDCSPSSYVITISGSDKGSDYITVENVDGEGNTVFAQIVAGHEQYIEIVSQFSGNYKFGGDIK